MSSREEEGLTTPKAVAKGLGLGPVAGPIAAAATLIFALAGGPAGADDGVPILNGTKHQILTEAQMDQVTAAAWITHDAQWVPFGGSYLYRYPGSDWVDPNKQPPPFAVPGAPAPTPGTPLPGGWTLINAQWVPYQGSSLYLYPGSVWVNANKQPPPFAPSGATVQ